MNLEKKARVKRPHVIWFHLCETSRRGKVIEVERRLMRIRVSEARVGCDGRWVWHFFLGWSKYSWIRQSDGCTTCEHAFKKTPLNYIKERFMVCQLCLICLKEEELYEDILVKVNSPGRITELPTVKGSGMGRGQGWEGPYLYIKCHRNALHFSRIK